MEWNLKEFFENESEFSKFIEKTEQKSLKFNQIYKSNLKDLTPEQFLKAVQEYEEICESIAKIMTYAYLGFAKDTTTGANLAKAEELSNKISENLLFFNLEFNELESNLQDEFIKYSEHFSYYLSLVAKEKKHQLSFLEERVLLRTSPVGASAFSRLFDESMAKLRFKFDDKELSEEEILSLLHDTNRQTRQKAAICLSATLEENSHLLTYIYNMIKTDLKITCELRNYELGEEIMHESNQIEKASVDALIEASEASFGLVSKFYEKKREILGLETLYDYDRYAPIGEDKSYSFSQAKQIVLDAFGEFSPKFGELAKKAFDEGWIDVYPSANKTSGAFSHSSVKEVHPFVLLNFTDKRRDVFTLAHELGHALHQYLAYDVGYLNSSTPLPTAETASVFCEMLVFDYILQRADKKDKTALLAGKLEDIFATLYRQINFTTFERRIHAHDGELSSDEISQIWSEESKKMFGDSLVLNDYYKIWWSYIPHFIHTPFYCYAYAYAQLLVLALFGLYKSGKCENFVQIYTEFLALGGSVCPRDMVAKFNLDINSREFWQIGLKEVEKLVDKFIS
ncbi:M3 family oligoendopeptidase [Campylobacter geochelonis]|uniref:Oligoendopeptidase F n=1 Tax=Campylobacter geochelonis TaxID=1780362 RepID=A0A128EM29_9BACT|nr:M3 family oligoendopeptidase [Campylobacter geochelonis]QKF70957.1 oligoendopeptidase F [Campylobacter geochelonis]CZE47035.1 oligoendopeptidase F [Campylobacter geochelonis]CZE47527.1 oligoendopeptidase F [Campylobacter geochelonis]CZE50227.1 oligoendopeptidase F [Campylobacter geochelonis]